MPASLESVKVKEGLMIAGKGGPIRSLLRDRVKRDNTRASRQTSFSFHFSTPLSNLPGVLGSYRTIRPWWPHAIIRGTSLLPLNRLQNEQRARPSRQQQPLRHPPLPVQSSPSHQQAQHYRPLDRVQWPHSTTIPCDVTLQLGAIPSHHSPFPGSP